MYWRETSDTPHNTMTNTERILHQLKAVVGGVQMSPDGKGCTECDIYDYSPLGKIFNDFKWPNSQRSNGSVLSAHSSEA